MGALGVLNVIARLSVAVREAFRRGMLGVWDGVRALERGIFNGFGWGYVGCSLSVLGVVISFVFEISGLSRRSNNNAVGFRKG